MNLADRGARWPFLMCLAASTCWLVGCSGDRTSADVAAKNKSNIQRLANLYTGFQNGYANPKGSGNGPKDEAEFKEYIRNYPSDKLQMMGIDAAQVDALFVSERDGKPFKIRYKVGGGRGSVAPVIFESEGVGGQRQVAFTHESKVEDVDAATYDVYWSGKSGSTPAATPAGQGPAGRPGGGAPPGAPTAPPG